MALTHNARTIPTITDVAERAGVSIKTVSRVMNQEAGVHPRTREQVLKVVAELKYRPKLSARSLAGARSFLIGLLYYDPSAAFVGGVQQGATLRCREAGYHLVVESLHGDAPNLEQQVDRMVSALRPDGMILTPPLCDNPQDRGDDAGRPHRDLQRRPHRAGRRTDVALRTALQPVRGRLPGFAADEFPARRAGARPGPRAAGRHGDGRPAARAIALGGRRRCRGRVGWPVGQQRGLAARVERIEHLGDVALVHCHVEGADAPVIVKSALGPRDLPAPQAGLLLQADAERVLCFDAQGRLIVR